MDSLVQLRSSVPRLLLHPPAVPIPPRFKILNTVRRNLSTKRKTDANHCDCGRKTLPYFRHSDGHLTPHTGHATVIDPAQFIEPLNFKQTSVNRLIYTATVASVSGTQNNGEALNKYRLKPLPFIAKPHAGPKRRK
eukprot:GHVT01016204.1.p1 GENE.GHVT01016204.1~~GHVT01016204.1.p1  ORF type:complete len:136 (-),score=3.67 GHVT01016204.1:218-625(-)